jgi:hypothetical protein
MGDEGSPELLLPISAIIQLGLPFGLVFLSKSVAEASSGSKSKIDISATFPSILVL